LPSQGSVLMNDHSRSQKMPLMVRDPDSFPEGRVAYETINVL
jgi:hypothetical protein